MKTEFSSTISSRAGSSRLLAILKRLMEFDDFTLTDDGSGGFIARKSSRKGQDPCGFYGLSKFRATPMGREIVVECDFGIFRVMRNIMVALLPAARRRCVYRDLPRSRRRQDANAHRQVWCAWILRLNGPAFYLHVRLV